MYIISKHPVLSPIICFNHQTGLWYFNLLDASKYNSIFYAKAIIQEFNLYEKAIILECTETTFQNYGFEDNEGEEWKK